MIKKNREYQSSTLLLADAIWSDGERNLIGRRTQSDRMANAIWSGGERNLIGRRTQSDRAADAIWSDGVRYTMTKRNELSKKKRARQNYSIAIKS